MTKEQVDDKVKASKRVLDCYESVGFVAGRCVCAAICRELQELTPLKGFLDWVSNDRGNGTKLVIFEEENISRRSVWNFEKSAFWIQ